MLPKQDMDKFDSVARLGLGRAIMVKNDGSGIAAKAAILALDNDSATKKARMLHLTSWVSELCALRAAEKEKNRAYRAAEKEKSRAYRAERFNTFMAYRAAEKEKNRAYRAELFNTFMGHRAA